MKKIIFYWIISLAITAAAVYSYIKVDFGKKTAMLFQTAFGDTAAMQGKERPQGQQAEGRPSGIRPGSDASAPQSGQNAAPGNAQGRPPENIISLNNVIPYTFILAFFAMITYVLEKGLKKKFSAKG